MYVSLSASVVPQPSDTVLEVYNIITIKPVLKGHLFDKEKVAL
jgi:hypothetical protein